MKEALKHGYRKKIAQALVFTLLKRQFAAIHISCAQKEFVSNQEPVLYIANHISVWDFSVATYLTSLVFGQDSFVMAAEYTLLPIATWAGAFSVNQTDSYSITKSIKYSVELLNSVPRCGLWMFPQGMVSPYGQRPLNFKAGTALIAKYVNNLKLVPVGFHYAFLNHVQLEVFVRFGSPFVFSEAEKSSNSTVFLENQVLQELTWLDHTLALGDTENFVTVLEGSHDIRYFLFRLLRKPYPPVKRWGRWY